MPIFDKKSDGLSAWVSRHVQKWGLEIKKYFQNHKKKLLLGALIAIALGPYLVSRLRTEPDDSELTFCSDDPKSVIDWILIPSTGSRGGSAPIFREYRVIDSDYPVYSEIEWVDGS